MALTKALGLCAALSALAPSPARACTTFCAQRAGAPIVGKSYDWHLPGGHVVVNKRSVRKSALVREGTPLTWVSRYASLTFNQYGRELPNGGMNERGLVIEIMWLDSSEYPPPDARPTVNELQWIQYQLDTSASLSDVARRASKVRVAPVAARVHYLVCDASGACGAFEYVDGKLVISRGKALPHRVLTNDTYADSLSNLRSHRGFGGKEPLPSGKSSGDRFVLAARGVHATPHKDAIAAAFELLDEVRNGDYSKWNIVYDLRKRRAYFRTLGHDGIKFVDLGKFDPSCSSPVKTLNMNNDLEGDVSSHFGDYDQRANHKLVADNMGQTNIPALLYGIAAAYPATTHCEQK